MSQDRPSSAAIDDPAVIAEIDRYQQLPAEDRSAARRQLLAHSPTLPMTCWPASRGST